MQNTILSIAYIIGLAGGVFLRYRRCRTLQKRKKPVPVGEKMMRSPGESLARMVEEKTETALWIYVAVCIIPVMAIVALRGSPKESLSIWALSIWAVILVGLGFGLSQFVFNRMLALSNAFLGLKGERLVGEMLNRLLKDGFDVFHDYPIEPDGRSVNIDHVVVGPNGVFAIETKTYRKPTDVTSGTNHELIYDGNLLKFPHFTSRKGIDQSIHNARLLGKQLETTLNHKVDVMPILTFPGWYVRSQSDDPLLVRNTKTIRGTILGRKPVIDKTLQKKIADEIALRCRDVEF